MLKRLAPLLACFAILGCEKTDGSSDGISVAEYYANVDELMANTGRYEGKPTRAHGFVQPGTIAINGAGTSEFILEHKGAELRVVHQGPRPDTFFDEAEVVAKGRLIKKGGAWRFESTELLTKCPSKYDGVSARPNPRE